MLVENTAEPRKKIQTYTGQAVLRHPTSPTSVYMIHDKGDREPSTDPDLIQYYGKDPKPAAWAMPGGGIMVEKGEGLIEGTIREIRGETGFRHVRIAPLNEKRLELYRYRYPESGHMIMVLQAELLSMEKLPFSEIEERDEVDAGEWFDVTTSLVWHFRNFCLYRRHLPYNSHIRRILLGLYEREKEERHHGDASGKISTLIHFTWRTVFPVGKGDKRFPSMGFRIPPHLFSEDKNQKGMKKKEKGKDWQWFMMYLIANKIYEPDLNCIYELYSEEIQKAVEAEKELARIEASFKEFQVLEQIDLPPDDDGKDDEIIDENTAPEISAGDTMQRLAEEDRLAKEWMEQVIAEEKEKCSQLII